MAMEKEQNFAPWGGGGVEMNTMKVIERSTGGSGIIGRLYIATMKWDIIHDKWHGL